MILNSFFSAMFAPRAFFENRSRLPETTVALRGFALLAGLTALTILILSQVSAYMLADLGQELQQRFDLAPSDPLLPPAASLVFRFVFAVLMWFGYLAIAAGLRRLGAGILGESSITYRKALTYSALSALPLFLGAVLAYLVLLLFTPRTVDDVLRTVAFGPFIRILVLFAAVAWEGVIFTIALNRVEAVMKRRAFMVWFAPIGLLSLAFILFVVIFTIYTGMPGVGS